jgi:hypothetical protein
MRFGEYRYNTAQLRTSAAFFTRNLTRTKYPEDLGPNKMEKLKTLLIANRGEIAVRAQCGVAETFRHRQH